MSNEKKQSIGGIWKKKTKAGNEFLSITINGKKYVAWLNGYKKEEKHPDFQIFEDDYKADSNNTQNKKNNDNKSDEENDLPF